MAKFVSLSGLSTVFAEIKTFVTNALASYAKTEALAGYVTSEQAASFATTAAVDKKITDIVGGAPETLDTLKEIATALGNDANLSATLTAEIAKKAASADVYTKTQADGKFALASSVPSVSEITASEISTAAKAAFAA